MISLQHVDPFRPVGTPGPVKIRMSVLIRNRDGGEIVHVVPIAVLFESKISPTGLSSIWTAFPLVAMRGPNELPGC